MNDIGNVFGKLSIRLVVASERDSDQIVVQLQIGKHHPREVEGEERSVQCDKGDAEIPVNPGMSAQQLGVQPCNRVGGLLDRARPWLRVDQASPGLAELPADLLDTATKPLWIDAPVLPRSATSDGPDIAAEVDMLPFAFLPPTQASRIFGEEIAEDSPVPAAKQLGVEAKARHANDRRELQQERRHRVDGRAGPDSRHTRAVETHLDRGSEPGEPETDREK